MPDETETRTVEWWLSQPNHKDLMRSRVFAGPIRRESLAPKSLYEIVDFVDNLEHIPLASISLLDKQPYPDSRDRRIDLLTVNLKNYRQSVEISPAKVLETMLELGLDTKYLSLRGYAPARAALCRH